jgi:hypothetical protein
VQLDLETGALDSSNLGDSGFVVIRDGQVVMKADFQEHFFDCPYQLASLRYVPETDQATDAAVLTGQVEAGDVIVLGSDGLFDNVPMEDILSVACAVEAQDGDSKAKAEEIASALGEMAFVNSQNPEYESPYALEARRQGYELSFLKSYRRQSLQRVACSSVRSLGARWTISQLSSVLLLKHESMKNGGPGRGAGESFVKGGRRRGPRDRPKVSGRGVSVELYGATLHPDVGAGTCGDDDRPGAK